MTAATPRPRAQIPMRGDDWIVERGSRGSITIYMRRWDGTRARHVWARCRTNPAVARQIAAALNKAADRHEHAKLNKAARKVAA